MYVCSDTNTVGVRTVWSRWCKPAPSVQTYSLLVWSQCTILEIYHLLDNSFSYYKKFLSQTEGIWKKLAGLAGPQISHIGVFSYAIFCSGLMCTLETFYAQKLFRLQKRSCIIENCTCLILVQCHLIFSDFDLWRMISYLEYTLRCGTWKVGAPKGWFESFQKRLFQPTWSISRFCSKMIDNKHIW